MSLPSAQVARRHTRWLFPEHGQGRLIGAWGNRPIFHLHPGQPGQPWAVRLALLGQEHRPGQVAGVSHRTGPVVHDVAVGVHGRVGQNRVHLVQVRLAE
jgi:hypothetical protein